MTGVTRLTSLVILAASTVTAMAAPASRAAPLAASGAGAPVFRQMDRAVSTWRSEAADSLDLPAETTLGLRGGGPALPVARCVKLNNYWCIKSAGWTGEIAADAEGHVAFATAVEGAAVAALLLKRYYVDFGRKSAMAIVSRWAPADCGAGAMAVARSGRGGVPKSLAPRGLSGTLRARWLASHARGFVLPAHGSMTQIRRSVVADRVDRPEAAPTIAVGLGEARRGAAPMTLDALLQASPNAPASRSMLGLPRVSGRRGSLSTCGDATGRIAAYAAAASAGIASGPNDDLALFSPDGAPTANLAIVMANMAKVEIGGHGAKPALIAAGIERAFPARDPP